LFQAPVFHADLAGKELNEVAGIIAIGRETALRQQTDLFNWQVAYFNIGTKQKYIGAFFHIEFHVFSMFFMKPITER
jgi:hypothetical protein